MEGGPPPPGARPRPRPGAGRPRKASSRTAGAGGAPAPPQAMAAEQAAGVLDEYASMSAEINDLLQGARRCASSPTQSRF